MTNTERTYRGVWLVAAIVAGLAMMQHASGETTADVIKALTFALVLMLALGMVHDASRRR